MLKVQTETAEVIDAPSKTSWGFVAEIKKGLPSLILVLLASSLLTVIFLRALPASLRVNDQSDYFAFYQPVARNILAGQGVARGAENPATVYPPGYPLILAGVLGAAQLLGSSDRAALAAMAVLGMGLITMFVFLLTRMLWGLKPALAASALWMTYPFGLWLTKQPNSEIPFMVVFYGGLCLFWFAVMRRLPASIHFLCGLVFGLAMLIRPIAIGIGLVMALVIWFARREISRPARALLMGMLLLGNFVAVLPWEAWVYARTGKVILLSTNGVRSMRDGLTYAVATKGYREQSNISGDVAEVMKHVVTQAPQINTLGQLSSMMFQEFRADPVAVVKLSLLKVARSWYGTDSGRQEWPIFFIQIGYLAAIAWASLRLWKLGGMNRVFVAGTLLMVLYFWGMTFLALSILRYMVPIMALLFVVLGAALFARSPLMPKRSHE